MLLHRRRRLTVSSLPHEATDLPPLKRRNDGQKVMLILCSVKDREEHDWQNDDLDTNGPDLNRVAALGCATHVRAPSLLFDTL